MAGTNEAAAEWLHIALEALAWYVAESGTLTLTDGVKDEDGSPATMILLPGSLTGQLTAAVERATLMKKVGVVSPLAAAEGKPYTNASVITSSPETGQRIDK